PDSAGHRVAYAGLASGGVWKTTNAGTTWKSVFDHEGSSSVGDIAVAPWNHRVVWVGTGERNSLRSQTWGDGVYRSADGGKSWKNMGLKDTREIGRIAIDPVDSGVVYVAALGHLWGPDPERGVSTTVDGGKTWKKVLFVDDTTGFVDLRIDPKNPKVLYAAGWHRLRWGGGKMEGAGAGSGIWRTREGGATLTRLTAPGKDNGLPSRDLGRIINDLSAVPDYYYNEVWVDPSDSTNVYLGATRLFHSTDGGRSFSPVRYRNVHVDNHALWFDPDDSHHMLLGNDGGVYQSYDGGESWAHQLIPASQFYEVDVDTSKVPYQVCGGLQDNGVWCGPSRTRERMGITAADWYTVYGGDGFSSAVSADSPQIRYAEYQYGNIGRLDVVDWHTESVKPEAEDAGAESGYPFRWDWNTPFVISSHDPTVLYLGGNYLFKLTDRGRDWKILGPDMTRANRFHPRPDSAHTSYHS
ncbi:MAG: glycosyl hydrolase, partial [Gemmatimonadota bacterium]